MLERGELIVAFRDGQLTLTYFDTELPINPRQSPRVFRLALEPLTSILGADNPALHEFQSIITSLQKLPPYTEQRPELMAERQREKDVARTRLAAWSRRRRWSASRSSWRCAASTASRAGPRASISCTSCSSRSRTGCRTGAPPSHEINYRRFFDVNTLAGAARRAPGGVRRDPHAARGAAPRRHRRRRPDRSSGRAVRSGALLRDAAGPRGAGLGRRRRTADGRSPRRPLYVVAEKILSGQEPLPRRWALHGTTGYNYLNDLNGLFVDGAHGRRMRRTYAKLTGHLEPFDDVVYASKRLIMETGMASELNVLAHMLNRIGKGNRRSRDFTLESLRDVITEVVACFPVYRTYVDEQGWTAADRAIVERAIARARLRNPAMESSLFDFFREVTLARDESGVPRSRRPARRLSAGRRREARERLQFAMKLQQYTGPVHAKGVEDTSFYRYNLLLSLNEVGGDPERFGRSVAEFHDANLRRLRDWPWEMIGTATHDTKLGEDVRARINVLSELPDDWAREVGAVDARQPRLPDRRRRRAGARSQRRVPVLPGADRHLAGGPGAARAAVPQPIVERLQAYMIKAVKEAKLHTSWLTPNQDYENAVMTFVESVLTDPRFLESFLPFQSRVAVAGMINSLAQVMLKMGSPGVPDFYQGAELWDLSLVDPDNRRPVDFERRRQHARRRRSRAGPRRAGARRRRSPRAWRRGRTAGSSCWSPRPACVCAASIRSCSCRAATCRSSPKSPSAPRWSASCACRGTPRRSSSRRASRRRCSISSIRSRSAAIAGRPRASCSRRS